MKKATRNKMVFLLLALILLLQGCRPAVAYLATEINAPMGTETSTIISLDAESEFKTDLTDNTATESPYLDMVSLFPDKEFRYSVLDK